MGLRDRMRRLQKAAEEDAVLIRQKDGSARAFDKMHVAQEMFLYKLDRGLGRTPRPSEVVDALDNATEESRHAVEEMFVGGFLDDIEPRDEPVPDLSENRGS